MDLNSHSWEVSAQQAVALQLRLKGQVRIEPFTKEVSRIAGADVSFNKGSSTVYAGFVVLDATSMQVVDCAVAVQDVDFPYIPGLLSFREIPPLLKAWKKLKLRPDVLVVDGQGIAHPRRFGIACHLGVLLNIPTIGCAKKPLTGQYESPSLKVGRSVPLRDRKTREQIGVVLCTKNNVNPVFVSPGHLMDFVGAEKIISLCVRKHRVPEPIRLAHNYVNQIRRHEI